MRDFTKFCLVLLVLVSAHAKAQLQVAELTGTAFRDDNYASGPIYMSQTGLYKFSAYAYIYSTADLAAAGLQPGARIDSIGWLKTSRTAFNPSPWNHAVNVYFKEVSYSTFSSGENYSNKISGATQVINLTQATMRPDSGRWTLALNTPYVYNGGNLEVMVDYAATGGTGNTSSSGQINFRRWTVASSIMGDANTTSRTNSLLNTTTVNISVSNTRPQTFFTYDPSTSLSRSLARYFRIYPNPATNSVQVENSLGLSIGEVQIIDLQGRPVSHQQVASDVQAQVDVRSLASGIYHIRMLTSRGWVNMPFQKQ